MGPPLLVRHGALGDMVLLTVAIRHLHARLGQPVDVLGTGAWARPLLEGQPGVGRIYLLSSRRRPLWLSLEQQRLVRALRARGAGPTWLCDEDSTKALSLLTRAGFVAADWCDHQGFTDVPGPHFCDLWLRFAYRNPPVLGGEDLPLTATDACPRLVVNPAQRPELESWLQALGLADRPLILLQAGNKRTMRRGLRRRRSNSKYWPEERWATVLRGLRALHPTHAIALLGVAQEAPLNDQILRLAGIADAHNLAPRMTVPRLMALAERAVGMISVDTGPAHVAAALDCPVVTLFGRSGPDYYAPRAATAAVRCLRGELHGQRSILGIDPAQVLEAWSALPLRTTAAHGGP
jgi:heptosyltransferase-2/heptosyltransferase-3